MPELERSVEDGEITREFLDSCWQNWPDHETARFLDLRIRKIEAQARKHFIEVGLICLEFSERGLWKDAFDPETGECFSSMDSWLCSACPVSRSSAYEALRVLKALPDLSVDQMKEIPRMNLRTLVGLSSGVRKNPDVIAAASSQTEERFKKTIQDDFPDQALEQNHRLAFFGTKSFTKLVEDTLRMIMRTEELTSREAALEFLVTDWINDHNLWKEME